MDDLPDRGVTHGAVRQTADGTGDRRGHDEDQQRGEHVGQIRQHLVHEPGQRRDAQGADRRGDHKQHDHPKHDQTDQTRRAAPGGELLHEPATAAGGEPLVDPGLLQTLGDGLVEHYGDDEADHQHDQGADQLR
jgi:hypothetical protein